MLDLHGEYGKALGDRANIFKISPDARHDNEHQRHEEALMARGGSEGSGRKPDIATHNPFANLKALLGGGKESDAK